MTDRERQWSALLDKGYQLVFRPAVCREGYKRVWSSGERKGKPVGIWIWEKLGRNPCDIEGRDPYGFM